MTEEITVYNFISIIVLKRRLENFCLPGFLNKDLSCFKSMIHEAREMKLS